MNIVDFSTLLDVTLSRIDVCGDDDCINFYTGDGRLFLMNHPQECRERVEIESIVGDLDDLLNNPILLAEKSSYKDVDTEDDSSTWTFYRLATCKGHVDIRWYGASNGYYSESVSFYETTK